MSGFENKESDAELKQALRELGELPADASV
jgi:hypothetical protein